MAAGRGARGDGPDDGRVPRPLDTDALAHVLATLINEHGLEAPPSRRIAAGLRPSIGTLATTTSRAWPGVVELGTCSEDIGHSVAS